MLLPGFSSFLCCFQGGGRRRGGRRGRGSRGGGVLSNFMFASPNGAGEDYDVCCCSFTVAVFILNIQTNLILMHLLL